ncbi:MAG TPA: glycosyltransferase [Gemmatimonadaceae bacterium]|nr:glycosyltransferase [Gemmatimonadaceae bacterium]
MSRAGGAARVGTAATEARPPLATRLLDPRHAPSFERRGPLPPPLRPGARLAVLDVTKWFGATSGGVRTYLLEKGAHVERHPDLRQVMVVPGAHDRVGDGDGVRCYQLASPPVPGQAPYRLFLAGDALRRIARHERPDLIEVGSPLLVPWLARRAARDIGVPLVAFHHGLLPHSVSRDPRSLAARLAWRHLRRVDRSVALTIVGSDYAAAELAAHGIESMVRVPLGVELGRFHPGRRARAAETRRRHGLPADAPLALFVGRLSGEKGLPMVLDAWREVARRTGAVLALVGDGPLRARLAARAEGLPVVFLPFQRDRDAVADLMAAADLYVSPGSIETFGLSAVEALASGTPVLSADGGAVAEHVRRSGAGATFPAGNAGAAAEVAVSLLGALSPVLSRAARAYAEAEHDWERVFERLFGVYERVLRGGAP